MARKVTLEFEYEHEYRRFIDALAKNKVLAHGDTFTARVVENGPRNVVNGNAGNVVQADNIIGGLRIGGEEY